MAILAVGVSHRRATVELLERLAFADEDYTKAYRRAADDDALDETVILSTCNRVEVYASVAAYHAGFLALKRLLCESRGVDEAYLVEPLYSHYEDNAAEHLFSVASGLDSMVLGEPQILTQVREAHRRAEAEGAAGATLTALFRAAARAGRRVRTETRVGAAPDAFVEAGTNMAIENLGGLAGRSAVVVGAGQMAAMAVRHLRTRDVGPVRVLNRSLERARSLAERHGAESGDLDALPRALAGADLVVSVTGAAGLVIREPQIREAMVGRDRPMFLLDLAVPRDVDPAVTTVPGVSLVDIDALRGALAAREREIAGDIRGAGDIVADEVRRFTVRRRSQNLAPLIRALRMRGDDIMAAELARFRSELTRLTPDERDAVEALARGIVSKLLHDPIVRLKELSAPGTDRAHARMFAELFGIEPESEPGRA
jgi:glutamyl-tRNA reductase